MTLGSYHTTVPVMDVGEALDIARATNQELHARGYADAAAAREWAADRLADVVEDVQARINHILAFCAGVRRASWNNNEIECVSEIAQLAQGIAPDATDAAIERAS